MSWHVSIIRKLLFAFSAIWLMPVAALALWAEPTCDPSVDPTLCNISAPLNVSKSDQTKAGGLTISGALTVNDTGSLTVNGSTTLGSTVGTLTVNGTSSTFYSPAIFNNSITATSSFIFSGSASNFSLTADSIEDADVSNTLTASIFSSGGKTNAVDLDSSEVAGILPSSSVKDVWVNTSSDTMTGTLTLTPTSGDALSITPNTSSEAIYISGATVQPLISLNPTGTTGVGMGVNMVTGSGDGIIVTTSSTSTGRGIYVDSSTSGYPVEIFSTGTATRSINVTNFATSGYGIYSSADGTTSTGIAGTGTSTGVGGASSSGVGVYGKSTSGYGGYFDSNTTSGTALYAILNSASTTTSSKALEVVGKNGYGGYFTTSGDTSTALYAENTNTTADLNKYGIQAVATTPSGVGISAQSDYGIAGQFTANFGGWPIYATADGGNPVMYGINNDNGGTGIELHTEGVGLDIYTNTTTAEAPGLRIDAEGGQDGIQVDASSTGIDVDTTVSYGLSIEANDGIVHSSAGFNGGQFYPNRNSGQGGHPNIEPVSDYMNTLDYRDSSTTMMYTGHELLILENSDLYDAEVSRYDVTTGDRIMDGDTSFGTDAADMVLVDDYIYVFDDDTDEYYYEDLREGTSGNGNTGATVYPISVTSDGDDVWIGTTRSIQEWTNFSGSPSTRVSSLGDIVDIIYADGYIYAADYTNDVVRKVDMDSPYTSTSITVGDGPTELLFDGASVWVANELDDSITRIHSSTNDTETYYTTTISTDPEHLAFDGANVWVAFSDGQELGYFNVATESWSSTTVSGTGLDIKSIAFDGTYIWYLLDRSSSTDYEDLYRVPTGTGFGTGVPMIDNGILMYSTSGTVYCVYISGSTLTASTTLSNCQ